MQNKMEKIFLFLCNHNMVIQAIIFGILLVLQVLFAIIDIDFNAMVITFLIGISLELFQIAVLIEFNEREKKTKYGMLTWRGEDFITKDYEKVTNNIFIIGINNNSMIASIYKNIPFVEYCIKKQISINIGLLNVYQLDEEVSECEFKWYAKGHLGKEFNEKRYKGLKEQFKFSIRILSTYECYERLMEKGLLHVHLINVPLSTAFFAYDIDTPDGIIQCQFYQYGLRTEVCPCVLLNNSCEMHASVKKSMESLWNDSQDVTDALSELLKEVEEYK